MLIGGALSCTLFGYPLAAGLVVESLDNTRKGFPTPLPSWVELSSRYILGLFGFLIDFVFYIVPLFIAALLFFCFGLAAVINRSITAFNPAITLGGMFLIAVLVGMFVVGVSPIGRLVFVQDSSPEHAMSLKSLREALRGGARRIYLRARLMSLPAYLPVVFFGALLVLVVPSSVPYSFFAALLLYWLTMSALLYAHLLVIQIYAGAEAELQRLGIERMPE